MYTGTWKADATMHDSANATRQRRKYQMWDTCDFGKGGDEVHRHAS